MDQIIIKDLQVYAHHGVYQQETEKGQNFLVSVALETDTRSAGMTDDLGLSTNYGVVCRFLSAYLTEHTFKLIETAAERTAEALLLQFPHVRAVVLEIKKPEAPIPLPRKGSSTNSIPRLPSSCVPMKPTCLPSRKAPYMAPADIRSRT